MRNTTGDRNTAIGSSAGDVLTTGSNNLILGSDSDPSSATASNQIVLGYSTTGKGDNTVTLGNEGVTAVYAAEDAGAVIYAAGLNLDGVTISANATQSQLC